MRLKIDTSYGRAFARVDSSSPASANPSSAMTSISSCVSPGSSCPSLSFSSTTFSSENVSSSFVDVFPAHSLQDPNSLPAAQSYIPWSPTDSLQDDSHEPDPDFVLAMHDFFPKHRNATCLAFQAGQIIHVLNRDPSGWWDGEVDGRRGWFPSNYVTATANLLTEEELPNISTFKPGHNHSTSNMSATSWTTVVSPRNPSFTRTDHDPPPSETLVPDIDSYCPAIMVPLLQGLSLLQNAVRSNRVAHFQPSTACIISCVRSILASTGCLSRDSISLQRFDVLCQERKRILSDLAALVTQSKKASDDLVDNRQREIEVEAMLRLGGQVFAHVRNFLAVAVQCGVKLPENGSSMESGSSSTGPETSVEQKRNLLVDRYEDEDKTDDDDDETFVRRSPVRRTMNGMDHRPRLALRAKSMTDLRGQRPRVNSKPGPSISVAKSKPSPLKKPGTSSTSVVRVTLVPTSGHRKNGLSIGSISSVSSSSSSIESVKTPVTPRFPDGPCSVTEVIEALRHTHDQYLSTIAAFIGHAHSHSRTSHASSTGHMFELVREVVEMVCKLLTIVDAVMKHPDVPSHKVVNLKAAKHGLFNVTTSLAESVRVLTSGSAGEKSEEQERSELLRSATNALKAGGDCVNEVKKCLTWSVGDKPIVIRLPVPGQFVAEPIDSKKSYGKGQVGDAQIARARSLSGSRVHLENDEMAVDDENDSTIQAQSPTCTLPPVKNRDVKPPSTDSLPTPQLDNRPLSPLFIPTDHVQPDLLSPDSLARTDHDRTTWEGSQRADRPSQDNVNIVPPTSNQEGSATEKMLSQDYSIEDVVYNKEGVLVGASLDYLVEKMTPHDNIVDPAFAAVFFLTFRMFATTQDLVNAIISRYNLLPPPGLTEEDLYVWQQRKGVPVRLRVANFLKSWLETYWRSSTDDQVLGTLMAFTRDALAIMFPNPSQRVMELIILRSQQTDTILSPKNHDAGSTIHYTMSGSTSDIPRPVMTKGLLAALKTRNFSSISVLDFDALELARQMTIMESRLYCAITAEEILDTGKTPSNGGPITNVNVKGVTTLSTVITGWIAESILNEADAKKRTALIKFFIKLSDRCNSLNNFSTPRAILAALDSSTISRLHQTWMGLPQKYKAQLEVLRKLADHARNYGEYRGRLRNTCPPAVPFLGLYLTDVTFCREGNPSHRPSPLVPEKKLINFNKYQKLARIVQDMQRFQIPYNFKEIPEVHDYLNFAFEKSKRSGDIQDLYRRSLLIEPKQPADTPPTNDVRQLFSWASRSSTSTAPTPA